MTGYGTCSAHKKVMTEKAYLYVTAIQSSSVWKGEYGLLQLILPAFAGVRNYSDNPDSAIMLHHPSASSQCHPAKNGD
jgi:hypothetical protein